MDKHQDHNKMDHNNKNHSKMDHSSMNHAGGHAGHHAMMIKDFKKILGFINFSNSYFPIISNGANAFWI